MLNLLDINLILYVVCKTVLEAICIDLLLDCVKNQMKVLSSRFQVIQGSNKYS